MRKPYILPFLRNVAILIAASLSFACHRTADNETANLLKNVESYISDRPDSALVVLQSINNEALSSKELKARHGLLLSMAFDKNFIDLTSDSLIAPVVEYYEGTKDYNHLFKAYYYLGRIYHNADRHNESMLIYSKALDISDKINDDLYLGLLHAQFGNLNYDCFNYESAIENFQKAYEYYEKAGKETYMHYTLLNLAPLYYEMGDWTKGKTTLFECMEWAHDNGIKNVFDNCVDQLFLLSVTSSMPSIVDEIIEKYGIQSLTLSTHVHYGLAYKYALGGGRQMFRKHIERAWETSDSNQDTTNILFTEYKSYKLLGDFEKSLQVYEKVFQREDQHVRAILNSPLMEERTDYLNKANNQRKMIIRNQKLTIHVIILSCLAVIFAAGFLILLIRSQLKNRTIEMEKYADMYESTLAERDALSEMLETQTVSEETRTIVTQRLEILNSIITSHISERDGDIKKADKGLDKLIADRDGFITSTRVTMEMSHPAFFKYLRERELTDWEINYCCLYLIGLKGKDIGDYINLKRHYVYGSAIRRKLGLTENDTNLSLYLQKTLKLM